MFDFDNPSSSPADSEFESAELLSDDSLESEIVMLSAHLSAATCRWLGLIAQADDRQIHLTWGCPSTAAWLSLRCGISICAAREHVRVGLSLEKLPLIHEAFSHGSLSYSKVRALTRVANSANESDLLDLSLAATGAQLEHIVRAYKGAREAASPDLERARLIRRFLRYNWAADGSLQGYFNLPPEEGAELIAAIERIVGLLEENCDKGDTDEPPGEDSAESSETPDENLRWEDCDDPSGAMRADALTFLSHMSLARENEDSVQLPRASIVLNFESNGTSAHIEDGPSVSLTSALRHACDATLAIQESSNGIPLSLGRRTRIVSNAQRRALKARDKGCRFPGCHHRRFVDAHHIVHWVNGGKTDMDNLILLCSFHHRLHHEGGYSIRVSASGKAIFADASGHVLPDRCTRVSVPPGDLSLRRCNEQSGVSINGETGVPCGAGERFDLGLTIDGLLYREGLLFGQPLAQPLVHA